MDPDSTSEDNYKNNIHLSIQHIELINIVQAQTIDELRKISKSTYNLIPHEARRILEMNTDLENIKKLLFKLYKDSLISSKSNQEILKKRIIQHIVQYTKLNKEQRRLLKKAFKYNSRKEINNAIKKSIPYQYESIINIIANFIPIATDFLTGFTYDDCTCLLTNIQKYDNIKIVDAISYTSFIRIDGKVNYHYLKKSLDFAKYFNKKIIIGTIINPFDMPLEFNELKPTNNNKKMIHDMLSHYVNSITSYIHVYENQNNIKVIQSIELLSESLNNQPLDKKMPYMTRYHIWKKYWWNREKIIKDKNITPGWFKFLNIVDICEFAEKIKETLPDVEIIISECNLENELKFHMFIKDVIKPIQKYEEKHIIKLVDSIGMISSKCQETKYCLGLNTSIKSVDEVMIGTNT